MLLDWRLLQGVMVAAIGMAALLPYSSVEAQSPTDRPTYGPAPATTSTAPPQGEAATSTEVQPFDLSPQQEAFLDDVLARWERYAGEIEHFECEFKRFAYAPNLQVGPANPNDPLYEVVGQLKYAAPNRGLMEVFGEVVGGEVDDSKRVEKMVFDGRSFFEFDFDNQVVKEWQLPEEDDAMNMAPLPFYFLRATSKELKYRYFLRVLPSPQDSSYANTVILEAWPKFQKDAADFQRAILMLNQESMEPIAIKIYEPNGTSSQAYRFNEIRINDRGFRIPLLSNTWWKVRTPLGWKRRIEEVPTQQATAQRGGTPPTR